jgi:hypothetical protein
VKHLTFHHRNIDSNIRFIEFKLLLDLWYQNSKSKEQKKTGDAHLDRDGQSIHLGNTHNFIYRKQTLCYQTKISFGLAEHVKSGLSLKSAICDIATNK